MTLYKIYKKEIYSFYLLVLSADNFCKHFRPRSGLMEGQAWSVSKLFDTLVIFLKEFFQKSSFWK